MKVSLNWIKEYTKVDVKIDELVKRIGEQLGAVEEVVDLGKKYQGIIVAKVVSCDKHPNADKLHVCKIDDGGKAKGVERDEKGYVQVVCGAPNVRESLLVAWLPPGATVPSTVDKDPFVLEARELRGAVSNGMLASAAELGLSDDHSGILELNPHDAKPGDDFAKSYWLDDYIIDIENKMFTHRPDCFGQLGVAREIAGISQQKFTSPEWYKQAAWPAAGSGLELTVKNELPKLVPRFMAVPMKIEANGPSTAWLQTYLARVGLRPINTIVDITNYVMMLTGQPLHAYDYDKVKALSGAEASLVARHPKKGEKITLLSGKEIEPRAEAIMIATDKALIGVGGVMGGADTEVDENTKNIILECASFDMYSIRKTSMEHGLFTDAVTRFNKGQSPLQNDRVLAFAAGMVAQLAGGKLVGDIADQKSKLATPAPIILDKDFVNTRLGLKLSAKEMAELLTNVECEAYVSGDELTVAAPFWRTDLEIKEDVVEEIGRLYGFDRLPIELPERSIRPTVRSQLFDFKANLRHILSQAGANEVLTYSFVHGDLLEKIGQDAKNAFELSNALSPDLQYYRQSLLPSLLDKVHANSKAGTEAFAMFEIGQTHCKDLISKTDKLPIEEYRLALLFAADDKAAKADYAGAPFYHAKLYLDTLLASLGIEAVFEPMTTHEPKLAVGKAAAAPFERQRAAYVKSTDGKLLGEIGEFKAGIRRSLKLPAFTAGFELDVQLLQELNLSITYRPLSRFPKVEQDISLRVPADVSYEQIFKCVTDEFTKLQPTNAYFDLEPVDVYQPEGKEQRHITLRIQVAAYDRTLKAEEINSLLDKVADVAKATLGAERI